MADLLLTHGYFLFEDEKELQIMKPYPTLGLLYLSAYLRRAGFAVEVFDTTFASREELFARLDGGRGVVGHLHEPDDARPVLDIVRRGQGPRLDGRARRSGGRQLSRRVPGRGADVMVVGEGEETLAELLPALAARGPHRLQGVAGTIFRDEAGADGHTTRSARRSRDLDALPWPDREQIDQQRYVDVWRDRTTGWEAST